jgi:iron complex transport system ATP-binding protein
MLAGTDLVFGYRPGRPVLRGVGVRFEPGTVTAVLGPNGAGKSTLLRLLCGLIAPERGSVTLGGESVTGMRPARRARRMAYVPQRSSLAFAFTTRDYVSLGRFAATDPTGDRAVDAALVAADLAERGDESFETLSAGQQQRASLARAVVQLDGRADGVLLLDEPFSALDPRHALRAVQMLRGLAGRGLTIAVVLHDFHMAALVADRVAVLSARGELAASGPTGQVLTPAVLDPVFEVRFETVSTSGGVAPLVVGPRNP